MKARVRRVRAAVARRVSVLAAAATIQRRSLIFVVVATLGLILLRRFEPDARYTFGHPRLVDWAYLLLLLLLGATHTFIAAVMWIQRKDWLPSEASMFRWISVKALLWSDIAAGFAFRERGIPGDIAYLYVLVAATTIDMDLKMLGRYVFGWESRETLEWNGGERRNGEPGRRLTDYQRGMR